MAYTITAAVFVVVGILSSLFMWAPGAIAPWCINHCNTFQGYFHENPHSASWRSWWHPEAFENQGWDALRAFSQGKSDGDVEKDWNILFHLGGNGPWVEKTEGIVEGGIALPDGCEVEQIHMMSRHAERYPTTKAGNRQLAFLSKLKQANLTLQGDLAFLNTWRFFTAFPSSDFEQLTTTGPFAGTLAAFTTGVRLRTRYHNLLPSSQDLSSGNPTTLWASDCPRVISTARHFAAGFFGLDHHDRAVLEIISEAADLGADTLTPGETCPAYLTNLTHGHDNGAIALAKFRATYLAEIRDRLYQQNPALERVNLTDEDLYAMQEMCGFETTVRGRSPWCEVFTAQEWRSFEYARDVIHYYRAGPGNPWGGVMGWLWLNATANLIAEGPGSGRLFFSFVHDGDIIPLLTALDIFNDDEPLPLTQVATERKWKTSQVTPMGGRIIFERLHCHRSPTGHTAAASDSFVRVIINDGVVALPDCSSGPGSSCSVDAFLERVRRKGSELGDFRERCGLGPEAPDRITFLHQ